MLRAIDITFGYGKYAVLDEVSLAVPEGELLGIIGPNGAGKSTLLRCLYGALRPNSGTVELRERKLLALSRREIARAIAVVPQHGQPAFPIPVGHFVGLGRFARETLIGGPSPADREVVRACLKEMELLELEHRSIDELSGGEFRRVLIAQALVQEPSILLFDEPIQQLDLLHQLEVMEFARAFARRPASAAVVVLHDLNLAARYCDTLALLQRGRIVARGAPELVLTEERIRQVWGVRTSIEHSAATGTLQIIPLSAWNERRAERERR